VRFDVVGILHGNGEPEVLHIESAFQSTCHKVVGSSYGSHTVGKEAAKSRQLCDRRVKPGGAVNAKHGHPAIEERFTVLYFTRPPLWVQRVLFGALAAIARALV
jgi:hypothetical protein